MEQFFTHILQTLHKSVLYHDYLANPQTSSVGSESTLRLEVEDSRGMDSDSDTGSWCPDIWPMLEVFGGCRLPGSISMLLALVVIL